MAQKKKASNFQNGRKQPALNDVSKESNKLEHLLTQQKTLKSNISYLQSMDCWETAFSNHSCV